MKRRKWLVGWVSQMLAALREESRAEIFRQLRSSPYLYDDQKAERVIREAA